MTERRRSPRERLVLSSAFLTAALRYWLIVFPAVRGELRRLRESAREIPDAGTRALALEALGKRENIEGAAAYAAFTPRRWRKETMHALVAFQAAYSYTDTLSEQPGADHAANARRLHEGLRAALDPSMEHLDYFEHGPRHEDGGYLLALLDSCRLSVAQLPAYPLVATAAQQAAERIAAFQSLSSTPSETERSRLERWAGDWADHDQPLSWWEMAAACGSSLPVHALIAAAADPTLQPQEAKAVADAYFPWIGGVHSMLDSLVDREEDADSLQLSLIGCYPGMPAAAAGVARMASRARDAARGLPGGRGHAVILAGMVAFYLHAGRQKNPAETTLVEHELRGAVGPLVRSAEGVFALRGAVESLFGILARRQAPEATAERLAGDCRKGEGIDAGAA
jgi:tetraprenyl-beta-curcumene synthase